jgi:hypothetical protein
MGSRDRYPAPMVVAGTESENIAPGFNAQSSAMDANPEKLHLMDYRVIRISSPYTWHRIIRILVI